MNKQLAIFVASLYVALVLWGVLIGVTVELAIAYVSLGLVVFPLSIHYGFKLFHHLRYNRTSRAKP